MTSVSLQLDGLHCASCVGRAERALAEVPGLSEIRVNLATEAAQVTVAAPERAALGAAADALDRAGTPVRHETVTLTLAEMSCASCVGRAERALAEVPGVVEASVNLASGQAHVTYLAGATTPAALGAAATAAGYPARPQTAAPDREVRKAAEADAAWRRVRLAGLLTLPVFVLEMGGHLIPALHMLIGSTIGHQASWILQFLLTTLVLVGPGRVFYAKGLPALARGAPDMNSLVALGTGAAYAFSVVATFLPGLLPDIARAVYFEAAAVIVTLILLGRFLEARAKGRTGAAIRALMGLQVRTARVLRDGKTVTLPVEEIAVGDILVLRPGERIAVDGEVTQGASYIDESMITGEPIPVARGVGDPVTAGTVNGAGGLRFRATRVGADTTLAQIIAMVEHAQGAKLPIQALVDRVTMWFVPAVMAVALVTVVLWLALGPNLTFALVAGVSVLIIACPCAMGLATPTSIMVGTGRAAEMGVLFRKGEALQRLSDVSVVAFDKTGTLTEGRPELTDLIATEGYSRAEVLAAVAAVEAGSEHPVAHAIARAAEADGVVTPDIADFEAIPGHGVRATVAGRVVLVGADRLMRREGVDTGALAAQETTLAGKGRTALYAAIDGRLAALIAVSDPVKPGSAATVAALHAQGLRVAMITGDKRETADTIAAELGIDTVVAGVLPEGKTAALADLGQGGRVAFVGDGINDAPALAEAHVGIAIGTGTDIAIEAADVVLMSGDPGGVVNAVALSRATMRNIRQNLVWAFAYNTALIPVAAGVLYPATGVLLSPMFAAGAMALSSVSVLANALRLRRVAQVTQGPTSPPRDDRATGAPASVAAPAQ